MEFRETTLENGLTVIAELNPAAQSVAAGVFVRIGSRDETEDVSGVSHFLEHMAFKGNDVYTADDVNRIFDELGANYNASPSAEVPQFYLNEKKPAYRIVGVYPSGVSLFRNPEL